MTRDRDIERVLDRWFEEGPTEVADRVISGALDLIDITHQRGTVRAPRRYSPMPRFMKVAAAAVVIAVAGGVALLALRPADPPATGVQHSPVPTLGLSAPSMTAGPRPAAAGARGIALGVAHSCAITAVGGVKCWGAKLGNGSRLDSPVPIDVPGLVDVTALAAGYSHTCALTSAGGVKCWGLNSLGQLGNGSADYGSVTPVDVVGLRSGAAAIAAGNEWTCAVTTAGAVKCWGGGGTIGNGELTDSDIPVDVVGLRSDVVAISAGGLHTCVVTRAGAIWCWGSNTNGELGDGSSEDRNRPVQVSGISGATAVATGQFHTCSLDGTGGVTCWGSNLLGQLGSGPTTAQSGPVDVIGLDRPSVAIGAGGREVAEGVDPALPGTGQGTDATCAVAASGIKCWGSNTNGQLGNGLTTPSRSPISVVGITSGATAVAVRGDHACALVAGDVLCWGNNSVGQLGDGSTRNSASPVPVVAL